MREIKLTQGKVALVDDEDYEWLNQWKWHAHRNNNNFYAERNIKLRHGKYKSIKINHEVSPNPPKGMYIDHIDGNGLNNQKSNLRNVTRSQNLRNTRSITGKSKYKGVSKSREKWRACIWIGKQKNLGTFSDEVDAAKAYDAAARELFGEYANLNFP